MTSLDNSFAEGLMVIATQLLTPINEAVDGYRADLLRREYSPTAAEAMAMEYHKYLFSQIIKLSLG